LAVRVVRDGERHRRDLLEHRGRVAVRDAGYLLAPRRQVELRLVRDLPEIEVEHVEAVLFRRSTEPHVAAHAAWPRERRIEPVDRHVRGADEVDLLTAGL